MAGRGKLALVLAVAGLLIAAALGCGGGDSTTAEEGTVAQGDATSTAPRTDTTGAGDSPGRSAGNDDGGSGGGSKQAGGDGGSSGSGGGSRSAGSGKGGGGSDDSGGGSGSGGSDSGSDDFTVPGGDNSVQEFGGEASAAEREQASRTLQTYMSARAAEEHQKVCASLSKQAVAQLKDLAEAIAGVGRGDSCIAIFAAIDENTPASARKNTMTGPISSLRVEGDRAFALYHGTKNTDYTIAMDLEGGSWKVGALVPYPLTAAG